MQLAPPPKASLGFSKYQSSNMDYDTQLSPISGLDDRSSILTNVFRTIRTSHCRALLSSELPHPPLWKICEHPSHLSLHVNAVGSLLFFEGPDLCLIMHCTLTNNIIAAYLQPLVLADALHTARDSTRNPLSQHNRLDLALSHCSMSVLSRCCKATRFGVDSMFVLLVSTLTFRGMFSITTGGTV